MEQPAKRLTPLEAAAKAGFDHTRRSLRERIEAREVAVAELPTFYHSLLNESNRALAVVSFSYITEKLHQALAVHLVGNVQGGQERLFRDFGPLSTANAMIKLAAALQWITQDTYRSLESLRQVRNEFAHQPFLQDLGDPSVTRLLKNAPSYEPAVLQALHGFIIPLNLATPRQRFFVRSALTCGMMMAEVLTLPDAIKLGLPPTPGLWGDGVDTPALVAALHRAAIEAFAPAMEYCEDGWVDPRPTASPREMSSK